MTEGEGDHQDQDRVDREGQQCARGRCDDQYPAREVRLADQVAVAGDGIHRCRRGFREEGPRHDRDEELDRKVLVPGAGFQQDTEDQVHDPEEHQRFDQRPHVSQRGTGVLQLELGDRKLPDEVEIPSGRRFSAAGSLRGCRLPARRRSCRNLHCESQVADVPLEFEHTKVRRIARVPPTICVPMHLKMAAASTAGVRPVTAPRDEIDRLARRVARGAATHHGAGGRAPGDAGRARRGHRQCIRPDCRGRRPQGRGEWCRPSRAASRPCTRRRPGR